MDGSPLSFSRLRWILAGNLNFRRLQAWQISTPPTGIPTLGDSWSLVFILAWMARKPASCYFETSPQGDIDRLKRWRHVETCGDCGQSTLFFQAACKTADIPIWYLMNPHDVIAISAADGPEFFGTCLLVRCLVCPLVWTRTLMLQLRCVAGLPRTRGTFLSILIFQHFYDIDLIPLLSSEQVSYHLPIISTYQYYYYYYYPQFLSMMFCNEHFVNRPVDQAKRVLVALLTAGESISGEAFGSLELHLGRV